MFRLTSLLVAGCLGAALACQAPAFMQQYKQRLGGAIDELATVVSHFDRDARAANMDRASAIERYTRSGDQFFVSRGTAMMDTINRWHDMSDHWRAMTSATALTRLPVFVSGLDSDLASRTWNAYKPSIPTTPEGLAYGGVGFLFSHMLFGGLLSLLRGGRRRPARHVDLQNTASS
jgi:outer membrane murein-binding lipoprotein Lpp